MGGADKMKAQETGETGSYFNGWKPSLHFNIYIDIKSAAPLIDRKQACTVRIENWWLLEKKMSGLNLCSVSPCLEVGGAPPQ